MKLLPATVGRQLPRSLTTSCAHPTHDSAGFTLIELLMVTALLVIMMSMAVPVSMRMTESMRLSAALRDVERELQTARLKAVTTNRPMRVFLNCPAQGQFRMVEFMNIAAVDVDAQRCSEVAYPYPSPRDTDPNTPSSDGPVRRLGSNLVLSPALPNLVLQFGPNGQTTQVVGGMAQGIAAAGVTVTIENTRISKTAGVNINGLGRIQVQ